MSVGNKVDPARSAQMARIRSCDTMPELRVRRALHAAGLRYRLHDRKLPGVPDIVFPSRRIALFVHGCFWHRHQGCPAARLPKSRQEFWKQKLNGNAERDKRIHVDLESSGWTVMVIWECESRNPLALSALAKKIMGTPVL